MIELFFKCTLKSNVVLNSTLATEGNIDSLDYIPGNNFLGIVANKLYLNSFNLEDIYNIIHSGKVKFGDATIFKGNFSYPMPFSFHYEKIKTSTENAFYLHHKIIEFKDSLSNKQFKQMRNGYFFNDGTIIQEVNKNFTIKSAHDYETKRAKDGQMFGYDAIVRGQEFVFSILFEEKDYVDVVVKNLVGIRNIGKSKTAEFGEVFIEQIEKDWQLASFECDDYTLVYAQSNLCFFNNNGVPNFQPTAKELGVNEGVIDWEKSQVRIFSYAPWNSKRDAPAMERHCISKGSVFYVKGKCTNKSGIVGSFQAEGLGRVLYNPSFLESDNSGKSKLNLKYLNISKSSLNSKNLIVESNIEKNEFNTTKLVKFLKSSKAEKDLQLLISQKVQSIVYSKSYEGFYKISSSQWGKIREIARKSNTIDDLKMMLFSENTGYLMKGVASKKYWFKNNKKSLNDLKAIVNDNLNLGNSFIEKFAAEVAKKSNK